MGIVHANLQNVLLVEDDADIRDAVQELLEIEGYRVDSVADGRAALEHLASSPPPKLILLDLMLPHVTGWEIIEILRNDSHPLSGVPIIITSAAGEAALSVASRVEGFLQKPLDLGHLLETVGRVCRPESARDTTEIL